LKSDQIRSSSLPRTIFIAVALLSLTPLILSLFGVDFGAERIDLTDEKSRQIFWARGAFIHSILEWSAFGAAIFTAILGIVHFTIKRDVVTPVIALSLLTAGVMDAFHTLAANRIISAISSNEDFIPFTWAICRLFNAFICLAGVGIFLFGKKDFWKLRGNLLIIMVGISFITFAIGVMSFCAFTSELPITQFPGNTLSRPWDVYPLVIYLASILVFKAFHERFPSIFSHALLISLIPNIMVQLHMALGSTSLFDSHFNIAHGLKIIAYTVPMIGLLVDYIATYYKEEALTNKLHLSNQKLEQSNLDLLKFAYTASHDLKAPLRGIESVCSWIKDDIEDKKFDEIPKHLAIIVKRVSRLSALIDGVLKYSRVDYSTAKTQSLDSTAVVQGVVDLVVPHDCPYKVEVAMGMHPVNADRVFLEQIFANLIGNAISHHNKTKGLISVSSRKSGKFVEFRVSDDGPGIPPQYQKRVFNVFETLQRRDVKDSSGIGLSIVKKIVHELGGTIDIDSDGKNGSSIVFSCPEAIEESNEIQSGRQHTLY
jgi:signal transduction histidine kinase